MLKSDVRNCHALKVQTKCILSRTDTNISLFGHTKYGFSSISPPKSNIHEETYVKKQLRKSEAFFQSGFFIEEKRE